MLGISKLKLNKKFITHEIKIVWVMFSLIIVSFEILAPSNTQLIQNYVVLIGITSHKMAPYT